MRAMMLGTGLLLLTACSFEFVKLAPGADKVRVVRQTQDMGACQKRGEIEVSVKDRLGPYSRDAIRVRDELETLARNEAPSLKADTVQPKTEPDDGVQRFLAFRCEGAPIPAPAARETQGAETRPLQD